MWQRLERISMNRDILIPHDDIVAKIGELAEQISSDYSGREPILLGILNGVVFFFSELVMKLRIPTRIDFIRAASYGSSMTSSGAVRFVKDVELPLKGEDVILIEDIVDTGLTLYHIVEHLKSKEPASLKICALIDKAERRERAVTVDYCGFKVLAGFLVGFGLDYDEKYRYLPDICVLR
jgi:hypoxanthine phosphoribosyltransferase